MQNTIEAFLKASGVDKFVSEFEDAEKAIQDIDNIAKSSGGGISKFANGVKTAAVTVAKVTATAATAFAVFGIKSAANMQVVEAQYGQAFKGVSKEADQMVKDMSNSFNILPERLKAPMSNFQAYFKGTGMEVNDSLAATEKAMTLAADSSAYYDKSIEDTSMSLKGMMMGNYENGDAIGINTNATKIAAAYNDKYGGSFEDLADAQKQNYILEYVEDIYALSGVMGQSERESKSFENVFSNLKSSLSTFAAQVMMPFMEPLINAMQRASEYMAGADEKFFALMETIKNSTAFQSLQEVIQIAMDKIVEFSESPAWESIKQSFADFGQAMLDIDFVTITENIIYFIDTFGAIIVAIVSAVAAFKLITGVINTAKTAISLFNIVTALMASPIGLAAIAIGILIGLGVLLWQNWDTIKEKLTELKDKFFADWEELKNIVGTAMTTLKDKAVEDFNELMTLGTGAVEKLKTSAIEDFEELKTLGSNATSTLQTAATEDFDELKTLGSNAIETLKTAAVADFNELKTGGSNAVKTLKTAASNDANQLKSMAGNAFKTLKTAAVSDFNELKNGASTAFSALKSTVNTKVNEAKSAAISKFEEMKSGVTGKMENMIAAVKKVGGGIKSFFDSINLYDSGRKIIQSAIDGLANMKNKITSKVSEIAGAVRDFWPFSPAKRGPLSDIHKMDFAGPIGDSIDHAKHPIERSMAGLASMAREAFSPELGLSKAFNTDNFDLANNTKNLNGSINQTVDHLVSDNMNKGKEPMSFFFTMGDHTYKAFTGDITEAQQKELRLEEVYAL